MPQSAPTSKVSSVEKTTGTVLSMRPWGHLLVVDRQCSGAAFARAAAVVGEVDADRAGAVGPRLRGGDRVALAAEPVEGGLGVLDHERIAARLAADGDKDSFGVTVGVLSSAVSVKSRTAGYARSVSGWRAVRSLRGGRFLTTMPFSATPARGSC